MMVSLHLVVFAMAYIITLPLCLGTDNVKDASMALDVQKGLQTALDEIKQLKKTTETLQVANKVLQDKVVQLEDSNVQLREARGTLSCFSVKLSADTPPPPVGNTIIFGNVIYNPDSNYSPATGIFTCAVSGTYVFHTSIMYAGGSDYFDAALSIDGVDFAIVSTGREANMWHQSSAVQGIVHCSVSQNVYVKVIYLEPGSQLMSHFTSFSGFLLQMA